MTDTPDLSGVPHDGEPLTGGPDYAAQPRAASDAMPLAPVGQLSREEAAVIARALFAPTVKRMVILTSTLVNTTASGDMALWAPLSTLEQAFLDLKWEAAKIDQCERLLLLAGIVFRRFADRYLDYAATLRAGPTPPPLTEWTEADTLAVYDEVERLMALPAAERVVDPAGASGAEVARG